MLSERNPTNTAQWAMLQAHARALREVPMRELFRSDPQRFERFSLQSEGILLDYSKNILTQETLSLLCALARKVQLNAAKRSMFTGEKINVTEGRAVLHTALRSPSDTPLYVGEENIRESIHAELAKTKHFVQALHTGAYKGFSGKPIQSIVHLGIGGSELGPRTVIECLEPYQKNISIHFVANIDAAELRGVLKKVQADTTLFFMASKTFTTVETLCNARAARAWFATQTQEPQHFSRHFMAITASGEKARAFGIAEAHIFRLWDVIGGRYSLWSSVGLPIACAVGFDNFAQLLEGAYGMDRHFLSATEYKNMPMILGLLSVWYRNFWSASTHAVLCYDHRMRSFYSFLQQLSMESNGKGVDREGQSVRYPTAPVLFGGVGTNAQHSFYQLLHQGPSLVPCDFIAAAAPHHECQEQHEELLAHFFANTRALMRGRMADEVREDLKAQSMPQERQDYLLPFKTFTGNRPTNTLLLEKLSPRTLGALLALYEHKTFVEGILWNIFSFDQWGVELGKHIAKDIQHVLKNPSSKKAPLDASTRGLMSAYRKMKKKQETRPEEKDVSDQGV